jgi:hypothetical protein
MKKLLLFAPIVVFALEPVLVSRNPFQNDPLKCYSANKEYCAILEYGTGTPEFIPIETFTLIDKRGNSVYVKNHFNHTVVDIADNGCVVGGDFDGPVSGKATLHFYDAVGTEQRTAAIGFLCSRAYSENGAVYAVMDGVNGLRVFKADGTPMYNLGTGNLFAISPDGSLAALVKDEEISIFKDGGLLGKIPIASPFIRQVKFSHDNSLVGFIDRKNIYIFNVRDQNQVFKYEETRSERNFISFALADNNKRIIAGLDEDNGRNSGERHANGYVYLFDMAGSLTWSNSITYKDWDIYVPEVRFDSDAAFWIRTNEEILKYSLPQ